MYHIESTPSVYQAIVPLARDYFYVPDTIEYTRYRDRATKGAAPLIVADVISKYPRLRGTFVDLTGRLARMVLDLHPHLEGHGLGKYSGQGKYVQLELEDILENPATYDLVIANGGITALYYALTLVKVGGIIIIKIRELGTPLTVSLIYLATMLFEVVHLHIYDDGIFLVGWRARWNETRFMTYVGVLAEVRDDPPISVVPSMRFDQLFIASMKKI